MDRCDQMRVGANHLKSGQDNSEKLFIDAGTSHKDFSNLIARKFTDRAVSARVYVLNNSEFSSVFENLKPSGLWHGCECLDPDEFNALLEMENKADAAALVICYPEYDAVLKLTFSSGKGRKEIEAGILRDFKSEFRSLLANRVKRYFLKLASLNRINQVIIGEHDFNTIFLTLAGELKAVFDFDRISLITHYPTYQSFRVECEYDRGESRLNHMRQFLKLSPEDKEVFGGDYMPIILKKDDIHGESVIMRLFGPEFENIILVPMTEKGQLLASLNMGLKRESEFDRKDLEWLGRIGRSVTGAVRALYHQCRLENLTANSDNFHDNMLLLEKFRNFTGITRGILHSFNNHLALIMGRAQILKQFSGDVIERAAADKGLGIILKSSTAASEQISLLQSYARIKPDEDPDQVPVRELFEEIVNLSLPHWKSLVHGAIEFKLHIDGSVRFVGFRRTIREALVNILVNAVEAEVESGGDIVISAENREDTVIIKIEDHGIGIARENLAQVFNPFYTTKENGTGLGLAVSYKIIHDHNGRIEIDSEPEQGTVVTITMPCSYKRNEKAEKARLNKTS
jgi:signal transduction histidine kinase